MSDLDGTRAGKRRWLGLKTLIVIGAVVVAAAIVAATRMTHGAQLHYFTAKIEKGAIRDAVEATGTVNAVITVQVGSQVSGTVAALHADFNSRVHKGEVIALIDPRIFEGALKQSKANLEDARASVIVARANLQKAKANEVQTKAEYDRSAALVQETVGSQQALDLAKANYEAAKAGVEAADANLTQARAQVQQREAAVSVARTNLAYTVIRSPIDGTVVARNVDVGQTVAASLQAPTIFTIAQDLRKMQVYVKVDESDVGQIRKGQPVTFKVDAFPRDLFRGVVSQVRMNPTIVQNVVTYDAIIDFENPDLKLFPGMTAYVTIPVATADDVMKIPNSALHYKPQMSITDIRALYRKAGIALDSGSESDAAFPDAADATDDAKASRKHAAHGETAVVWKLDGGDTLEPVQVALGITDHTYTAISKVLVGKLGVGDDIVTSSVKSDSLPPGARGFRR